jgi:acetate kinase
LKTLVINVGSTSLKFRLLAMPDETTLAAGRVEGIGQPSSEFSYSVSDGAMLRGSASFPDYAGAIEHLVQWLLSPDGGCLTSLDELGAVGFKTVLAKNLVDAVIIDDAVIAAMEEFSPLAPAHNPPYLAAIRGFQARLPNTPLVGLFEPAFHKTMPEYAWRYALPYDWVDKYGIRRYGFHGASHRWAAEQAARMTGRADLRLVSCHLGGSSSVNATHGLTSLDNSFGMTPQSGLMQSGRPGDLDPFIILYLQQHLGMSPDTIHSTLYKASGFAGLSGVSGEVKDVLAAAAAGNERAALAINVFVYQVRKAIGAAAAVLGGLDVLLFTGGIGERSAALRARICENLEFLGVQLDASLNESQRPDADISQAGSPVRILIVEANEELIVARACAQLVQRL